MKLLTPLLLSAVLISPLAAQVPPDDLMGVPENATAEPAVVEVSETAAESATANAATSQEVIDVTTVQELLAALGSDRVIRLAGGDYNLTQVAGTAIEQGLWTEEFDGKQLNLSGIDNLTLTAVEGAEPKPRILTESTYSDVLRFENSNGIRLRGLTLGHAPEQGNCTGAVIEFENSSNIILEDLDLFGCGTEGLTLLNVQNLKARRTAIHSCNYGILTASACSGLSFTQCVFANNRPYYGFQLDEATKQVSVTDSLFLNNQHEDALFGNMPSRELTLRGNSYHNADSHEEEAAH